MFGFLQNKKKRRMKTADDIANKFLVHCWCAFEETKWVDENKSLNLPDGFFADEYVLGYTLRWIIAGLLAHGYKHGNDETQVRNVIIYLLVGSDEGYQVANQIMAESVKEKDKHPDFFKGINDAESDLLAPKTPDVNPAPLFSEYVKQEFS